MLPLKSFQCLKSGRYAYFSLKSHNYNVLYFNVYRWVVMAITRCCGQHITHYQPIDFQVFKCTYLDTISISAYMWWLNNAEIYTNSHVFVDILHRSYASHGPTDMMLVYWVFPDGLLAAEHSECNISLQDVKVPCDHWAFLWDLYQKLKETMTQISRENNNSNITNSTGLHKDRWRESVLIHHFHLGETKWKGSLEN